MPIGWWIAIAIQAAVFIAMLWFAAVSESAGGL